MNIKHFPYRLSILILLLCIPGTRLFAQENVDYVENWNLKQTYDFLCENRVWMKAEMKDQFNLINLEGTYQKGDWMAAQDASKLRQLRLRTEGKRDIGNFSVWGRFQYTRAMEDSTRMRHQTRINPDAPIYFGSLRNNYYERDIYEINGILQYGFANGKIPVGVDFDYRVGNHFSNNDPRGRISDFQFDTRLFVGYKFDNSEIYLSGLYGYGRERVAVGYKNDQHLNNTSNPLYINWYMNGYGRAIMKIRDMNYNDDIDRYGISLMASRKLNPRYTLFAKAEFIQENQFFKFYDSSPLTYQPLNEYSRQSLKGEVFLNNKGHNPEISNSYRLKFGIIRGDDFNYDIMTRNYVFMEQTVGLAWAQALRKWQIAADLDYLNRSSEDGSMGIKLQYAQVKPAVSIGYRVDLAHAQSIIPSLGFSYQAIVQKELTYPVLSPGIFSNEIILQDYSYYATPSYELHAGLDYQFKQLKRSSYHVGLNSSYIRRADLNLEGPHQANIGRDRFNLQFNLSVFF